MTIKSARPDTTKTKKNVSTHNAHPILYSYSLFRSVSAIVDHYLAGLFLCAIIHISVCTLQVDMVYRLFVMCNSFSNILSATASSF